LQAFYYYIFTTPNYFQKTLDKWGIMAYIVINMTNIAPKINDKLLIKWYIDYCIEEGFNQTKMAERVNKTRSWASLLVKGKITRLCFDTRNDIKKILGIQ